jgi:LmbE family N-acetylglucosaminyl deacetylase
MKMLAVMAHPDDESLGFGGTLAKYAAEGVDVSLLTATRGERGRYRGHRAGDREHPGPAALASLREGELRNAAAVLGVRDVTLFDYPDGCLDAAVPRQIVGRIAEQIARVQPDVIVTFGPDGAYGHPDHIAISQFTTAAVMSAAVAVSKLYYLAWPQTAWDAYQAAVGTLSSTVDGVARQPTPWPEWALTTVVDTRSVWPLVWRAVLCHDSQVSAYERLIALAPEHHEGLWGRQSFYRVFSTVNGGRATEVDLFEGVRS